MDQLTGRTAVITGGGSGIGLALGHAFAAEGMNIVVADLAPGRAEAAAAGIAAAFPVKTLGVDCDVSDEAQVEALAERAYGAFGEVALLCNNAGVVRFGPLATATHDDLEWLFKVNLWGVMHCVRAFTPRMKAQATPAHIVNTASLSGVIAVPGMGVYTAAKYGVVGVSETLRDELKPFGIGVSVLCPGPTPTRLGETARFAFPPGFTPKPRDPAEEAPGYADMLPLETVAQCVVDGVKANRLYLFSHARGVTSVRERFEEMLRDYDAAPVASPIAPAAAGA